MTFSWNKQYIIKGKTFFQKGSERAREVAGQTLSEVKGAMGLHYFN
ncbi:tryptophanyl-tRNA synthetase [Streptococcus pneumoniae]|nr:tryptophanyl-tRNA synthetase [Streptococcus pneumoniae]